MSPTLRNRLHARERRPSSTPAGFYGGDDPGHAGDESHRVPDLDIGDRNNHPPFAEQVDVALAVGGPVGKCRMVQVAEGLEADRDRRRVADVRVLPPTLRELDRVLEVAFSQQPGPRPVESYLLEPALQAAVHVATPALALLQQSHQVPGSPSTPEPHRREAIDEELERHLPCGEHMVDEHGPEGGNLEGDIDHGARQRRHRDPAAVRAVHWLEEGGPVYLEALQGQVPALGDGQLEYRLDLWQPPQHPGRLVRGYGVSAEAAGHQGLLECLGGSEPPADAGVHLTPVRAARHTAPLARRHPCPQRLCPGDQYMLCRDEII